GSGHSGIGSTGVGGSGAGAPALGPSVLSAPAKEMAPPDAAPVPAARRPTGTGNGAAAPVRRRKGEIEVYWGRLFFAASFLLVLLIAGFVAAILDLKEWNTLLVHSFELLLGIFMGLLGGDIANRAKS